MNEMYATSKKKKKTCSCSNLFLVTVSSLRIEMPKENLFSIFHDKNFALEN